MTATIEVAFDDGFFPSTLELSAADNQRVTKAFLRLRDDPSHPSLRLKPLQGDKSGKLHSVRAADDIRILLHRSGNVFVLLKAGTRQSIYNTIERGGRWVTNPSTNFIGFIEPPEPETTTVQNRGQLASPPISEQPIFNHWSDSDLAQEGLQQKQIDALRSCLREEMLFDLGLSEDQFDLAVELISQTPEQRRSPKLIADDSQQEAELRDAITNFGSLHGISPLFSAEEIERIANAPIEDWMIFLHPDQRSIADRRYEGPARVRGSAGTGKTVVALHRAAALAHRFNTESPDEIQPSILFTTYIKSLPPVFENLYNRLPTAIPGAIEFVNIDKLARRVCARAGVDLPIDPRAIDAAYASAFKQVIAAGSPLEVANITRQYLRDEITAVIKGRGIQNVDLYLGVERTGRRLRFGEALRRQTWQLMHAWDAEMQRRGTCDFVDVVLKARDIARTTNQPSYRAAIIDESQDLSLVGLQFVRSLVNGQSVDRQDGLLIVGDGAQRIYAGGFTLRQAGINVAGRATVLRTNYRNTSEIITTAMAIAGNETVDDLGDEFRRGEADATATRSSGFEPTLVVATDFAKQCEYLIATITQLERDLLQRLQERMT